MMMSYMVVLLAIFTLYRIHRYNYTDKMYMAMYVANMLLFCYCGQVFNFYIYVALGSYQESVL